MGFVRTAKSMSTPATNVNTASGVAINPGAANLLVAVLTGYDNGTATSAVDNKTGNTWTLLTKFGLGGNSMVQFAYCKNPVDVSNGLVVTFNLSAGFTMFNSSVATAAYSGGDVTAPADKESGNSGGSSPFKAAASVTPSATNALILTVLGCPPFGPTFGTVTDPAGFTRLDLAADSLVWAELIETSIVTKDPQWAWDSGSGNFATAVEVFLASAGSTNVTVTPSGFGLAMGQGSFTTQADTTILGITGYALVMNLGSPVVIATGSITMVPAGFAFQMLQGIPFIRASTPIPVTRMGGGSMANSIGIDI